MLFLLALAALCCLNGQSTATLIASSSNDKTIKVWDIESGICVRTLNDSGVITQLQQVTDGQLIGSSFSGQINTWSLISGKLMSTVSTTSFSSRSDDSVTALSLLAFSDAAVVSGFDTGAIKLWSLASGEVHTFDAKTAHYGPVRAFEPIYNGDTVLLASGGNDGFISNWNMSEFKRVRSIHHSFDQVTSLRQIGTRRLASGSADGSIKIWTWANEKCERKLEGHTRSIGSLELVSRAVLASGSRDKTIRLRSLDTGKCIQVLTGHSGSVMSLKRV